MTDRAQLAEAVRQLLFDADAGAHMHAMQRADYRRWLSGLLLDLTEADKARAVAEARRRGIGDALRVLAIHGVGVSEDSRREVHDVFRDLAAGMEGEAVTPAARPAPTPTERPHPARDDDYGSAPGQ
ncbi:hypothetical protein [Enterococcus hirae]|uniref:hypothetical protein n=1 Tax=Enterococcus hirae TaxID=1354 RepID=UPI0013687E38|nr:hypothetical protein [Enterococcus hirae]NAE18017.1 hypothetical protein [Enterococcus hirae]